MKSHWFLPDTPDVLATLTRQAEVTVAGMQAFRAWAAGSAEHEAEVRDYEHEADGLRRVLARDVRIAFSTPLDQEDLYTLSERLDAVLNAAKNVVREADAFGLPPDRTVAEMAAEAADCTERLRLALSLLVTDPERATAEADAAITSERRMEKAYRAAMRTLLEIDHQNAADLMAHRELYRRTLDIGERIAAVAERIWYAVVKEA
jgi:uncharacterized protein Yka (UPF0111/DUF47 family)